MLILVTCQLIFSCLAYLRVSKGSCTIENQKKKSEISDFSEPKIKKFLPAHTKIEQNFYWFISNCEHFIYFQLGTSYMIGPLTGSGAVKKGPLSISPINSDI